MKLKAVSGIMLTLLMASIVMVLASPIPVIAQTDSTTTVYLDPPTINGAVIGQEFTVNLNISDAVDIYAWQAGLTFNASVLNCTSFSDGEFLSDVGDTYWFPGTINNTAGVITPYGSTLIGDCKASGDGRLAYVNFTVIAPGFSDLHLYNVIVADFNLNLVPANIIDVYTVVVDTAPHTVVTISNSTDLDVSYDSGFYDHAFSQPAEKISFKVTGPHPGFSNVTIPKTLLNVSTLDEWRVAIDGTLLSTGERTVICNATHSSIYFTYSAGIHYVQITTRPLMTSTISITLSSTNVTLGLDITISGDIDLVRPGVSVTILYRCKVYVWFSLWTTLATLTTDSNSYYSYTWTPETVGTYEFMAMWEGDDNTFGDVSDVKNMTVLEAPPPLPPPTTVYLDPPTVDGTAIGVNNTVTVNLNIRDAQDIYGWQAGLIFNATLLECTSFFEGEFLSDVGLTYWFEGTINNTAGVITAHGCLGYKASGDGQLAYLTFKVKALGVSDLHFRDVTVIDYDLNEVPINIIDVYTVIVNTTPYTVVTVSNSTGYEVDYGSGFYDHAFSLPDKEISFKVTGPYASFSNVTIPKTLLNVSTLDEWRIIIDGIPVSRSVTYNDTHHFIYFTYSKGTHNVQIIGTWVIAPPPEYTLIIYSSPTGVTFTVDGVSCTTPWSGTYSEGASVSLVMPETYDGYVWSHWLEDEDTNRIKTVTMDTNITLTGVYAAKPVGGKATLINIPINKPELPALWVWLTILLPLAATTIFVKLKKKKQ